MTRAQLLALWVVLILVTPIKLAIVLYDAVAGPSMRSLNAAIGEDEVWNGILGGDPHETISHRCGQAYLAGKPWARLAVAVIDFIFGAGHCVNSAR